MTHFQVLQRIAKIYADIEDLQKEVQALCPPITAEEARRLGYRVTRASDCEVGLVKNGKGIRTWWCADFDRRLPGLDHPTILEIISWVEASGLS